jgi:hypothetical protein
MNDTTMTDPAAAASDCLCFSGNLQEASLFPEIFRKSPMFGSRRPHL